MTEHIREQLREELRQEFRDEIIRDVAQQVRDEVRRQVLAEVRVEIRRELERETASEPIQKLLAHSSDSAGSAQVFRKYPDKKNGVYLARLSVEELADAPAPEEVLRERFGGGEFLVVLRGPDSRYVRGGRLHFCVAGEPLLTDAERTAFGTEPRPPSPDEGSASMNTAVFIELYREVMELQRDLVRTRRSR